jgi:hypothetical protein
MDDVTNNDAAGASPAPADTGAPANDGAQSSTNSGSMRSAADAAIAKANLFSNTEGMRAGDGDKAATDAGETQTPEQIAAAKTAADAEAARVAALTPEQIAAEEKAAADKAQADLAAAYRAITLPSGWGLEQPMVADVLKIMTKHNAPPELAQDIMDHIATDRDPALVMAVSDHVNAQRDQAWFDQAAGWKTATEKEFSPADLGGAKLALTKVFDGPTIAWLDAIGLTNHPVLVRGMARLYQAMADDTWTTGNAASADRSGDARRYFPNSNMAP